VFRGSGTPRLLDTFGVTQWINSGVPTVTKCDVYIGKMGLYLTNRETTLDPSKSHGIPRFPAIFPPMATTRRGLNHGQLRPKPQNLGGLVGGEAEFDPLGFSDTFDATW
jgi:hypothetical protein